MVVKYAVVFVIVLAGKGNSGIPHKPEMIVHNRLWIKNTEY